MDDDATPPLTRCFRGHATPAGKTFCDACGAPLADPTAAPDEGEVPVVADRRRHYREPGDVVPASERRRLLPRR